MAIKKNIKFDLPIGGIRAKNMQEIREHFTLEILEYARNGTLVKWLRSRKLEDELTAVQALSELDDDALFSGLCTVFSVSPRQNLLTALAQLRGEFNAAKVDIKTREKTLERALSELARSVSIASNNSGLKEDNFITQAVINTNIKIAASLAKWREDVSRQQRNTEFRENFGDSLLVYVYGKVKVGKSSIGNYVAYGHGDPNRSIIDAAEPTPEFFCEAIAEDAKKPEAKLTAAALEEKRKLAAQRKLDAQRILAEQRKFAVGACETTASIQGFKLSGLTWIDSPGLHSRTEPKGELAQGYVDAADLILYSMSSSQPGRNSDLNEIADLLQKGKCVEVVITRCDVTDEDVNDAGELVSQPVMKSEEDRKEQSDLVHKRIFEIGRKQLEVLTVSVRYAEEHNNNLAQIEKSGMNHLFRRLTKLTQDEGVRLKKETPLNNLRAVVNHILTGDLSVKELRDDLTLLETDIAAQRRQLKQKQTVVIGRVLSELNPLIEEAVRKENTRRDIKALEKTCTEHLQRIVSKHVDMELREIFNETQSVVDNAVRFQELKQLPQFRDLFDVMAETMNIFSEAAHKTVDTAFTEIDNNFLKPIEQQVQTVNAALDHFVSILKKELYPQ